MLLINFLHTIFKHTLADYNTKKSVNKELFFRNNGINTDNLDKKYGLHIKHSP